MAYMAKDKIVRTGTDINLATVVDLQTDATALASLADTAITTAQTGVAMVSTNRLVKVAKVALVAATGTTGGGVLSWANPEGAKIIIERVVIDITTAATSASRTVDFGVAANGTTPAENLLDAAPVSTIAILDNITDKGTAGKTVAIAGATEYVTGTASASVAGLVGFAYIHYVLA